MKVKKLSQAFAATLAFVTILAAGCQSCRRGARPLVIEGLGPVERLNPSEINYETLQRIVEAVVKAGAVTQADARVLAEVYGTNASNFADASARMIARDDTFDYKDVRAFLKAVLEHEQTRDKIYSATLNEATRLIRAEADFYNPASGQARVAGRLMAAYSYAYAQAVLHDKKDAIADEYRKQRGVAELLTLSAYDYAARDALNNAPGTTPEGRQQAQAFRDALVAYNEALPANEKIMDNEGRLIDRATANGEQLRNLYVLANGQVPPGLGEKSAQAQAAASVVNRFIQPAINNLTIAMNDAL